MQIYIHQSVFDFLSMCDTASNSKAYRLIRRLEIRDVTLAMPDTKPLGSGLWELRIRGRPAIRLLYGFCSSMPAVVVAFKKQSNAIKPKFIALAKERVKLVCSYYSY
jgi:putative component of toxin-antitoxin plasmid stabilization module